MKIPLLLINIVIKLRFNRFTLQTLKILFISIITLIYGSNILLAQNKTIDSLRQVIKTAKHDTTRINAYSAWGEQIYMQLPDSAIALWKRAETIAEKNLSGFENLRGLSKANKLLITEIKKQKASALNNIGYIYNMQGDIPKALEYYNKSLIIQEKIIDKKGMAYSFNNIGMIYKNQGDIHKALEYLNKSLIIQEDIGDKYGMAYSFNNIGMIYNYQGDIHKALEYLNKSLITKEDIGDKYGIAQSFNNIGTIYQIQSDIPKALEYYNKSLNIQEEIGDKNGIATSFNNIGTIYNNQANVAKSRQDFVESDSLLSKALEYYNKSLKVEEEIIDKDGIASSFNNIGMIYHNKKDIPKALEYFNKSLMIQEEIDDKNGMANSFNNIGSIYFENNDLFNAKNYLEKGYKISKELGYPERIEYSSMWLKKINEKQGNYKLAYEFYTEEMLMHDSIQNEENYKKTQKQQAKYEYEKKAATDSISNAKAMEIKNIELSRSEEVKKKQLVVIYSFIIGFIIIIFFSIIIYRLFIQKKKANIILSQQKEEISAQRDEIETQRDLVTEQKEHIEEIHKEVTDSINYAERIQRSFLATKDLLDEHLNDYFVLFHPKDVVSGDFYWAGKLNNGNFALVTADSTGHGVPGAIMSILNISSIEKAVEKGLCEPSEILNHTRKSIIERLKKDGSAEGGKDGMDASLICFDFAGQKFLYSAANNPIWVVRAVTQSSGLSVHDTVSQSSGLLTNEPEVRVTGNASANHEPQTTNNELFELSPDKMPIGKHDKEQISFSQSEFQLQKGDTIYTLSDGMPDQFGGPKGKKFLSKNLKQLLVAHCELTMEEQKLVLEKTLVDWIGEGEQIDDITILGIRI